MGWDGSGNYNRIFSWVDDATADIKIQSDRHDSNDDDMEKGISNCLTKDGQSQPVADIPMNGHKITNHGLTLATDAPGTVATKGYVDAIKTFSTELNLSGADLNGRINFTSTTGAQGITWTGVDMAWISRVATAAGPGTPPVPPATINRLVLNDKADGTGTDVIQMRENGAAEFAGGVTSATFYAKAATGNVHLWFYGPANEDRMVLYSNAAAAGSTFLRVTGTQSFEFNTSGQFKSPGAHYAGAAFLDTNGNITGTIWANLGYNDAYSAIVNRIESRCAAFINGCVQQTRVGGLVAVDMPSTGNTISNSGYFITMIQKMNSDSYRAQSRLLQIYVPSAGGWIAATSW